MKKTKNIIIIGCGSIGFRYLEGILSSNCNFNLELTIVDKSKKSINSAKELISLNNLNVKKFKINWSSNLKNIFDFFDLAIISTTAKDRASISQELSKKSVIDYWIFEKVLTQTLEDLKTLSNITKSSKEAWVNLPRRLMPWFQKLKNELEIYAPFCVKRTGGLWAMCSNTVHWLDLVNWWSNEDLASINTDKLNRNWFESKRVGNFENTGEIECKYSRGSKLVLKSEKKQNINEVLIEEIDTNKEICRVDLISKFAKFYDGTVIQGETLLQSQLTGPLISSILESGNCKLPTLKNNIREYQIFFKEILKNWNYFNKSNSKILPIT